MFIKALCLLVLINITIAAYPLVNLTQDQMKAMSDSMKDQPKSDQRYLMGLMNSVFKIEKSQTRRLADDETTVKKHQRHKEMYDLHKKLFASVRNLLKAAAERVEYRKSEIEAIYKIEMDDSIACVDPKIAAIKKAKADAMTSRKSLKEKVRTAKAAVKETRKNIAALRKDFWRMKGRFDDRNKNPKEPAGKLRRLEGESCAKLKPLWTTHHKTAMALMAALSKSLKLSGEMLDQREKCMDKKHEMRDKKTPKAERQAVIKKCTEAIGAMRVIRMAAGNARMDARKAHKAAEQAIYTAEEKMKGVYSNKQK